MEKGRYLGFLFDLINKLIKLIFYISYSTEIGVWKVDAFNKMLKYVANLRFLSITRL